MDFQVQNVDDWKDIKSIINLVDKVPVIRLYAGDSSTKTPSVFRGKACFNFNVHRMNQKRAQQMSHCVAWESTPGPFVPVFIFHITKQNETESVMNGGKQYWYEIKRCVKQTVNSHTGDHSQLHFEALQHQALYSVITSLNVLEGNSNSNDNFDYLQ